MRGATYHQDTPNLSKSAGCVSVELRNQAGMPGGPHHHVLRVNGQIAVVIDVRFEILFGPVVERVRKKKTATRAAAVIDWMAGERRMGDARGQARPVHVDDTIKYRSFVANLTGDGLGACGP